jgi:hypothetical protein
MRNDRDWRPTHSAYSCHPPRSAEAPAAGRGRTLRVVIGRCCRSPRGHGPPTWPRAAEERFDVLVMGGGITGAGVALHAAAQRKLPARKTTQTGTRANCHSTLTTHRDWASGILRWPSECVRCSGPPAQVRFRALATTRPPGVR